LKFDLSKIKILRSLRSKKGLKTLLDRNFSNPYDRPRPQKMILRPRPVIRTTSLVGTIDGVILYLSFIGLSVLFITDFQLYCISGSRPWLHCWNIAGVEYFGSATPNVDRAIGTRLKNAVSAALLCHKPSFLFRGIYDNISWKLQWWSVVTQPRYQFLVIKSFPRDPFLSDLQYKALGTFRFSCKNWSFCCNFLRNRVSRGKKERL